MKENKALKILIGVLLFCCLHSVAQAQDVYKKQQELLAQKLKHRENVLVKARAQQQQTAAAHRNDAGNRNDAPLLKNKAVNSSPADQQPTVRQATRNAQPVQPKAVPAKAAVKKN